MSGTDPTTSKAGSLCRSPYIFLEHGCGRKEVWGSDGEVWRQNLCIVSDHARKFECLRAADILESRNVRSLEAINREGENILREYQVSEERIWKDLIG